MKSDIDGQEVREIAILVVATFKKEKRGRVGGRKQKHV